MSREGFSGSGLPAFIASPVVVVWNGCALAGDPAGARSASEERSTKVANAGASSAAAATIPSVGPRIRLASNSTNCSAVPSASAVAAPARSEASSGRQRRASDRRPSAIAASKATHDQRTAGWGNQRGGANASAIVQGTSDAQRAPSSGAGARRMVRATYATGRPRVNAIRLSNTGRNSRSPDGYAR
jgi:hypothetical protein